MDGWYTIVLGLLIIPIVVWLYRDAMKLALTRNSLSPEEYFDMQNAWAWRATWMLFGGILVILAMIVLLERPEFGVVLLVAGCVVVFGIPSLMIAMQMDKRFFFPPQDGDTK